MGSARMPDLHVLSRVLPRVRGGRRRTWQRIGHIAAVQTAIVKKPRRGGAGS